MLDISIIIHDTKRSKSQKDFHGSRSGSAIVSDANTLMAKVTQCFFIANFW